MQRHFTATAFIVDSQNRTLLLWHKRLKRWMPPGGHIDEDETPEECAARECKEETGLDVEILGLGEMKKCRSAEVQKKNSPLNFCISEFLHCGDLFASCPEEGRMLKTPIAMLLENIPASEERGEPAHQHMDFLFLARVIDETQQLDHTNDESGEIRWFTREEVEALDETTEIFGNVKQYILDTLPHSS